MASVSTRLTNVHLSRVLNVSKEESKNTLVQQLCVVSEHTCPQFYTINKFRYFITAKKCVKLFVFNRESVLRQNRIETFVSKATEVKHDCLAAFITFTVFQSFHLA